MIDYVKGNAALPTAFDNEQVIIAHGCNDAGLWGAGFTASLDGVSAAPRRDYILWHESHCSNIEFKGGNLTIASYKDGIFVANMITQRGVRTSEYLKPVRYLWIASCLNKLRGIATSFDPHASVHMPRIGCGLAGGEWKDVEPLVEQFLTRYNVRVRVYDL